MKITLAIFGCEQYLNLNFKIRNMLRKEVYFNAIKIEAELPLFYFYKDRGYVDAFDSNTTHGQREAKQYGPIRIVTVSYIKQKNEDDDLFVRGHEEGHAIIALGQKNLLVNKIQRHFHHFQEPLLEETVADYSGYIALVENGFIKEANIREKKYQKQRELLSRIIDLLGETKIPDFTIPQDMKPFTIEHLAHAL